MSTIRNEKNDLYVQVNSPPGKESDVTDFEKGLDTLLNKEDGSEQEAVEVMTAKVKELRRKYVGCPPWVIAEYFAHQYLFWLGNCIYPQLHFSRKECSQLRRTL